MMDETPPRTTNTLAKETVTYSLLGKKLLFGSLIKTA